MTPLLELWSSGGPAAYRVHRHAPTPEERARGDIVYRPDGTYEVVARPLTAAQRLERDRLEARAGRLRRRVAEAQVTSGGPGSMKRIYRPPAVG